MINGYRHASACFAVLARHACRTTLALSVLALSVLALAACATPPPAAVQTQPTAVGNPTPTVPAPVPTPTVVPTPTPKPLGSDWSTIKPNELGKIMILEYHIFGEEEERWVRSYDNFWRDLEMLHAKGYRPVGLNDIIDNRIDVPAGYSPVALTFDDSSPMQFRFIEGSDGQLKVDPNCAVGILERFHEQHPDWPLKATFFVLPAADPPHNLFGQDEYQAEKLRYLVDKGFEIGNHTFWHQRLDTLESAEEVAEQLGRAVESIQALVPGYNMRALALPLGMLPENPSWAYEGAYEGATYRNEMILLASGGPTLAPDDVDFDPYDVPRIQATNMELDFEEFYVDYFDVYPEQRYVSDGDPDTIVFPASLAKRYRASAGHSEIELPSTLAEDYMAVRLR